METKEFEFKGFKASGFVMLFVFFVLLGLSVASFFWTPEFEAGVVILRIAAVLGIICALIMLGGNMMLEPNEARAMVFFGKYVGTFSETGYFWVNPFLEAKKVSLRARNLDVAPIKVNDKIGNPILIGLVLVWRLKDSYKALFEIDSQTMAQAGNAQLGATVAGRMGAFENFVKVQSDAALRQVAGLYAYDNSDSDSEEITLRSDGNEVNEELVQKLNERLAMAGMEVIEARINYLAYAPEIAAVMLRRQQASAIITAREKIVEGAVTMVKMARNKLSDEDIVELDEDKKAAMVSNLLVVLCADEAAQPVLNTGTLNQ